ncbi:MAG: molybdopterin molybdenumtransferase MoeA, partial [Paracoccaceae bacterium]|nr:molybdopterin molybdenumtransferase MoeA [Paracoccaceae bacterium]
MRFDRVAILDWSAAKGPRRGRDSIWLGIAAGAAVEARNIPTRAEAEAALHALVADALNKGERVLIGADFAFGYPAGFARALTGQNRALAVWDWLAARISDTPRNVSNYRDVAAAINAGFPGEGPFWGNGEKTQTQGLPRLKPMLPDGLGADR